MRRSIRRSVIISRLKAFSSFLDNFTTLSGMKNGWIFLSGSWSSNGTSASSATSASSYPISYLKISKSDFTASVDVSAGTGIAFWVTDSGSWYATSYIQDNYTYDCNPSTSCGTCDNCCNYNYTTTCTRQVCYTTGGGCTNYLSVYGNNGDAAAVCSSDGGSYSSPNCCFPSSTFCYNENYSCTQTTYGCGGPCGTYSCNCSTTYQTCNGVYHLLNLIKSASGVVSTLTSDVSLGATAATIWMQTSGNDITIKAYSDTAKTTQIGTTMSHTASTPARTGTVGIIKVPSDNQASTVDSFTVTVTS